MEHQARSPQTAAPTVAPPAQSTPTRRNAAAQSQLGTDPLAAGATQSQQLLREQTDDANISVGGRFPAHMQLGATADGDTVSTGESSGFKVGVTRTGIYCHCHPPLRLFSGQAAGPAQAPAPAAGRQSGPRT